MTNNTPGFASTGNRGFQMTFKNGMTISVQFGAGNYCSRRNFNSDVHGELKQHIVQSPDAEIAIWDSNGDWFYFGSDQVRGYITPDEVADWIEAIRMAKDLDHLHTIAVESNIFIVF